MSLRDVDPCRLDVAAFAKAAGELRGRWPLAQFDRLVEAAVADGSAHDPAFVSWSARGEVRALRSDDVQIWLHLSAATSVRLECQRCLKPVAVALQIERDFLFVQGEDAAALLDAESDADVLALTRSLDLRELIEDELLLAVPLVPRHEVCAEPLPLRSDEDAGGGSESPFAALAALKGTGPLN